MKHQESKSFFIEDAFQHLLEDKVSILKKALIHKDHDHLLNELIEGLHPSEIAYLIQYLDSPYRQDFVLWLKPHLNPEIFLFLATTLREDIIQILSEKEIASVLEVLESDDALELLTTFDEKKQSIVLDELNPEQRKSLKRRLDYPAHSAGRLMQEEFLALSQDWTIQQSLQHIAASDDLPHNLYDGFVVDESTQQPVGTISLGQLIKLPKSLVLGEVMEPEIRTIPAQWDQEEVAFVFRLYDLMSAPVVNEKNQLVGMITIDDVVDVIERKATEDLMHMGRIHSSDFHDSVLETSFSRLHWLILTLCNTLLTSLVIDYFQEVISLYVILTILMPIAAAMGGNSGTQTATVIIRALATRELSALNVVRTFFKELKVALINGLIFALLLGIIVFCCFGVASYPIILGSAVLFNMIWAGLAGTLLPLIISRCSGDPALSTGPLLTTTTDIIGYALFLKIATLILQ
jgi:magnesium transporter